MEPYFEIDRGDTAPSLLYALLPTTVVLTGATVRFSMRDRISGVIKINRALAVIVTATVTPTVRYDWQTADTLLAAFCDGEFEVTYANNTVETFPADPKIDIRIVGDIA